MKGPKRLKEIFEEIGNFGRRFVKPVFGNSPSVKR
jgi:hypothetical protein